MEKTVTPEQQKFLDKTRVAAGRARELAAEAHRLNLPVLAREWDYFGKELESKCDLQERAFRDGALQEAGK